MTRLFVSEAEIRTENPEALGAEIAAYWDGYDVEIETSGACTIAKLGTCRGMMQADGCLLRFRLECPELGMLEIMRSSITETFLALAKDERLRLDWRGEMPTGRLFADFREVRLVANVEITPRIRRLTFTGDDVVRFGSAADIHVRIYFPPDSVETPEWPRPGPDGRTIWPEEGRRPEVRYYTVRRWRPESSEIDVDFVMHDDEGPGSAFAGRATPGAIVGMAGPVGRVAPNDGWTLYAGDETALPAIARMLEEAPREARGVAFIEVNSRADEIPLSAPSGVSVRWLHRRGAPAGATDMLLHAVTSAPLPLEANPFVWAACEATAAKAIRKHLKAKGLARDRFLVVGYWQREAMDAAAA